MDRDGIEALRNRIRAQADGAGEAGWLQLPVPPEVSATGILRVPRGAFERWAVSRSGGDHLTVPWTAVSPRGLKLRGDDRYHSDWMLGAGLALDAMSPGGDHPHREALLDAAYAGMAEVSRRLLEHESTVLLPGPDVTGRIHHPRGPADLPEPDPDGLPPVLVLRDAGPDFLGMAVEALDLGGAVVVERGGQMAHLVTVLRGEGRGPILRMDGARRLFPSGGLLTVSPSMGRLRLQDDGRPSTGQGDGHGDPEPDPPAPVRRDAATGDGFFPHPGPEYAGPPDTWPLRHVGEEEDARIRMRDRSLARRAARDADVEAEAKAGPFRIVPRVEGRTHPAQSTGRMEPFASYEAAGLKAYANLHWDGGPSERSRFLELIVWETGSGEGRRPRSLVYYGPRREWTDLGIRRAADRAIAAAREVLSADPDAVSDRDEAPGMGGP